jgi:hypothetical protein
MNPVTPTIAACVLALSIGAAVLPVAAESDSRNVPVFELLAARTAEIESQSGIRTAYHHRSGRMAMTTGSSAESVPGTWWIDADGNYCMRSDHDANEACYRASMSGAQLRLTSTSGDATLLVRRLLPGDVNGLLTESGPEEAACDCRVTARRRGARATE